MVTGFTLGKLVLVFFRTRPLTYTPKVHAPILFVITSFPVSAAIVVLAFWSLPFSVSWPRTLADCSQLGRELHGYAQSDIGHLAHVVAIISVITIWMHAWSIPGSVLWVSPRDGQMHFVIKLC